MTFMASKQFFVINLNLFLKYVEQIVRMTTQALGQNCPTTIFWVSLTQKGVNLKIFFLFLYIGVSIVNRKSYNN